MSLYSLYVYFLYAVYSSFIFFFKYVLHAYISVSRYNYGTFEAVIDRLCLPLHFDCKKESKMRSEALSRKKKLLEKLIV